MNVKAQTRSPAVAGMFYPSDPAELSNTIKKYLEDAGEKQLSHRPLGIIAPHAGFPYSGYVAAYSYNEISGYKYSSVVVLSPCHVDHFPFASIYNGDAYETPLGTLPVDKKRAKQLVTDDHKIRLSGQGHARGFYGRGEHSLEIQLPFLQVACGDVSIIPIVIGTMDYDVIEALGKGLGRLATETDILIVASSDLSHYHPYNECQEIDQRLMDALEEMHPQNFYSGLTSNKYEACGGAPITALLIAAKKTGANHLKVLKYANSGDVPFGDKSQVVGYVAAAVYQNPGPSKRSNNPEESAKRETINAEEQLFLIELAENTIRAVVQKQTLPEPEEIPAICREKRGAFVTIEKNGQLRGCIGYILPMYPLYKTVIDVAQSAALRDPRFDPVTPQELPDLSVEVSVLTVPQKIKDVNIIQVGKHGLIIKQGYYQGLLLPQVATEYGWDRDTFLEHTCLKAGLPRDAWQDQRTEIQIFSAQVFNRETLTREQSDRSD